MKSETKRPVVLIVEDEILIRMDAVDMVKAAGFDVVVFPYPRALQMVTVRTICEAGRGHA